MRNSKRIEVLEKESIRYDKMIQNEIEKLNEKIENLKHDVIKLDKFGIDSIETKIREIKDYIGFMCFDAVEFEARLLKQPIRNLTDKIKFIEKQNNLILQYLNVEQVTTPEKTELKPKPKKK